LAIGTIVIAADAAALGSLEYLQTNFADESGPLLFNVLLAATPFLVLAMRGITTKVPWAVGLAMTLLVRGYVVFKFTTGGFEGGTSVGNAVWLGMVLISSTIVITFTCYFLSRGKRSPHSQDQADT
jgi:hypothetical protein